MRSVKRQTHFIKVLKYVNFELNGEINWKRTLTMPEYLFLKRSVGKYIPSDASYWEIYMRFYF